MYGEYQISKKHYQVVVANEETDIVEKTYIIQNAINGKSKEADYLLGDVADAGIDNVLEQFGGALAVDISRSTTAAAFVTNHAADYIGGGVVATSVSNKIIFTSDTPGTVFTGVTSISNTSGDLNGVVVNTNGNVIAVAQVDKMLMIGFNGACEFGTELGVKEVDWDTDLETTVDGAISSFAADWLSINGIIATKEVDGSDIYLVFTANVAGTEFTTVVHRTSGSLDATINHTQINVVAEAQIDSIILNGTSGTADITCDGVTEEVAITEVLDYSESWNTRSPGGEADPIIEIVGGEMGHQYSRPKHLIQMNIQELSSAGISLNMIGKFEDDLNQISGNNRNFVFNAGELDVKPRLWNCDLCEIID